VADNNSPSKPTNPVVANRNGLIGRPVDRVEGALKVSGRATYSYEYRGQGATAYGFIVESTAARARITEIDTQAAESSAGVLTVLTFRNAPRLSPTHPRVSENRFDREEPFLQGPDVRYFGEPVAIVVADTFETARHAATLVRVRYARDPNAIFDLEANRDRAYRPGRVNAGFETDVVRGDFDAAFARAPVKIDATYLVPDRHNNPMEPHAAIAEWNGDSLTLHSAQQIPVWSQSAVAKTFRLPIDNVRIVTPYIGGGFGAKVPTHAQAVLAAMAAKVIGRPVKVALTRQQMFANTNHRPRTIQRMRLGAERDGTLTAIAHECFIQTTFHDEFVEQSAAFSRPLYAAPNRAHRHRAVMLDLPSGDIMRAPGEEPGSFAMECGMDELAAALAMDPVELRIRNEPQVDPETGLPFSSRSNVQCLQEGARRFGWNDRPRTPRSVTDGQWLIGYGVACALFPTYLRPSSASVRLSANGRALARMSATDIGTGTYTILAQIAGECLGLALEDVDVEIGDSMLPPSAGSGGSFGAASAGTALLLACEQLRGRLAALAASDPASPLRGVDPASITLANSRIEADGRSEALGTFMSRMAPQGLEVEASHHGAERPPRYSMHAHGAQFVEVGVDRDTGEIRLRRMLGVFACGRILNAKTARSQLIGGMIMGIGAGLSEESLLDVRDGSFVNRDLAEYHVAVNADIADIDAVMLEEHEDKANPLGIKGLGEVGIVGAGAAVANAVYNATGVRVREFPVTLDKLLPHLPASGS
jgi:xanthine dehydrogenase YagR molybdenum-binding subunit